MQKIAAWLFVLFAVGVSSSVAAEEFTSLKLKPGDYAFVTDASDVEVGGSVVHVADRELQIAGFAFAPREVVRIERRGDPTWDGALKGFAIGALAAMPPGAMGDDRAQVMLRAGVLGGLFGTIVDTIHVGRTSVYRGSVPVSAPAADPEGVSTAVPPAMVRRGTTQEETGGFSGLRARPGDVLYVTLPSGTVVKGPLTALTPSRLTIGSYELEPQPGMTIDRRGDTVLDGAARGFLLGAILASSGFSESCLGQPLPRCVLEGGASMGLLGALIDGAHVGRTRLLRIGDAATAREVRLRPLVDGHRRGLTVRWQF